ncbi:hypothetical protein ACFQ1E_17425 [Sphingomonas canadensis]|uniref:Uncharacterized protein n=1 Tax=Sphingomonas canadensis TaxID=1219257 RepID=A0ABW3H9N4_9SPHN|nr:hypothetical protein [Sphingomonas canadensis]MCW3837829.1 hypothetical protein [Sphingomonas canadensis]
MSSLVRRIEKNIMKAAGLKRRTLTFTGVDGRRHSVRLIATKDGEPIGLHWPRAIPRRFMAVPR